MCSCASVRPNWSASMGPLTVMIAIEQSSPVCLRGRRLEQQNGIFRVGGREDRRSVHGEGPTGQPLPTHWVEPRGRDGRPRENICLDRDRPLLGDVDDRQPAVPRPRGSDLSQPSSLAATARDERPIVVWYERRPVDGPKEPAPPSDTGCAVARDLLLPARVEEPDGLVSHDVPNATAQDRPVGGTPDLKLARLVLVLVRGLDQQERARGGARP